MLMQVKKNTSVVAGGAGFIGSNLCRRLLRDGSQTRSFMYIDDLIEALVRMTATAKDVTGPANLGNPDERSVNELADMVVALTGSHSRTIHIVATAVAMWAIIYI